VTATRTDTSLTTGPSPPSRPPAARPSWRESLRPHGGYALIRKLFLATAAVIALVIAGTLLLLTLLAQRTADAAVSRGLLQTRQLVTALLDGRERSLASGALVFAQAPTFRDLVLAKRPSDMFDQANEAVLRTGASWVQIIDDQGVRLAKSDEPTAPSAQLAGSALISGALGGEVMTGSGVAGDSLLFQAVAVPIYSAQPVIGVLMAAQVIDSTLAQSVKEATASEIVIYVVDTAGAPRVAGSTLPSSGELTGFLREFAARDGALVGAGDTATVNHAELTIGDAHYVGQGRAMRSAGGEILGGFVALRARELEMAPFTTLRRRVALAGLLGMALAFGLSAVVARRITRPLLELAAATRRVAEGDYSVSVDVRSSDEIGTLAEAMRSMVSDLQEKQSLADVLNVAHSIAPLGDPAGDPSFRDILDEITETHAALTPGRTLANRYRITEVLGVGGAGVVYKAVDTELNETIAIKTLRPDALLEERALERLKSEIRLARRISHRNVVRIHDFGEAEGIHFITMEFVAGTSLADIVARVGAVPVPAAMGVAKQLGRALEVAHEQGIIHRDIKPPNLMVQPDGVVKVMDFGVARLVKRTAGLTLTGMVVGTPAYMAPEQLLDDNVDARADIFAAGVVLYECLTGRRPVEASSPAAIVGKLLGPPAVPPH
jgi:serine/threonine-protein kinase